MLKYSALHYDEKLVLKVPPLLWLSVIYGTRHLLVFVGAAFLTLKNKSVVTIPWLDWQTSNYFMLTDLPAVLVLLAIGHRVPNGLNFMRWIWVYGRWLLLSSYVAGIALFSYLIKEELAAVNAWDFTSLLVFIIDFAFVGYLLRSELVKDVFKDFPVQPS